MKALLVGFFAGVAVLVGGASAPAADGTCTTSAGVATCAFASTGAEQTFTVPAGVTQVSVTAVGGSGGGFFNQAAGAVVQTDLTVTPGDVLYVEVGGNDGGFNGPGAGGSGSCCNGWGGGGASDVRTSARADSGSLASRLVVAGGGGGAGGVASDGGAAGSPGEFRGGSGGLGGGAGTATAGGAGGAGGAEGGTSGQPGVLGAGGAGGSGEAGGGGGGGGFYGGGGGGGASGSGSCSSCGGGGGGGSSYPAADVTGLNGTGTPSVTISYTPPNTAPVAVGDSSSTDEDTALTVAAPGVLGNDSDVDGDALTAVLVSGPAHGTLTLNANGSFTYTPAANYNGPDSFTYKANDGRRTRTSRRSRHGHRGQRRAGGGRRQLFARTRTRR